MTWIRSFMGPGQVDSFNRYIFLNFYFYLFIWIHQILVAALGISLIFIAACHLLVAAYWI